MLSIGAFAQIGQVTHRHLGGSQQQVGGVIGKHPVVLFRHRPVAGP